MVLLISFFLIQNLRDLRVLRGEIEIIQRGRRCNGREATARLSNVVAAATAPQSMRSVLSARHAVA